MEKLKEILLQDHFAAGAGVELMEVREGYAKARMLVTEKHLNAGGVCQGGALFSRPLKSPFLRDIVHRQYLANFLNHTKKSFHGSFEVIGRCRQK